MNNRSVVKQLSNCCFTTLPLLGCAPGGARFLRVQVPNLPGSGKDIAEDKGVAGDCKSEGSRMWGTTNPWANLWSDEQKL